MKKKAQTMIYDSWFLTFKVLPDEKAGQLIKAIGDHVLGKPVRLPDDLEDVANEMFETIDEAKAAYDNKCEQMRANAKQRFANGEQMQTNADQLEGKKKKKKNEEKEKEKEYKEILSKESTKKDASRFLAPSLPEIESYIHEKNLDDLVNAESFFTFYESKGWFVGKSKMKDWKAAVRGWASRTKAEKQTATSQTEQQRARLMAILEEPDEEGRQTPW